MDKTRKYVNSPWNDENKKMLMELRQQGFEYSAIAKQLTEKFGHPFTKNGCVSQGQRCGAYSPERPKPGTNSSKPSKPKLPANRVIAFVKPKRIVVPIDMTVPNPVGPLGEFPETGLCKWIHGDPSTKHWQCCAAPAYEKQPYCKVHVYMSMNHEAMQRIKKGGTTPFRRRL